MTTVRFSNGKTYVVCKASDGKLYAGEAGDTSVTLAALTANRTHDTTNRGWFYVWDDSLYYFDSAGGSKWNPARNSGKAYRAGLCKPTYGATPAVATGGEKEGFYRVCIAYRNSRTKETGIVTSFNNPPVETRLSGGNGGLSITNVASQINAAATDPEYEWDRVVFYSTRGTTEWLDIGSGGGCVSYYATEDVVFTAAHNGSGSVGMNKADHVQDPSTVFTNEGGEPPASTIGAFDGNRAVYGGIYQSSTLVPDRIMFSTSRSPTSVPQIVSYTVGSDSKSFYPRPYIGEIVGGIPGGATTMVYGAGMFLAFSSTSTVRLLQGGDGRLYGGVVHPSIGCCAESSAVAAQVGVHWLGSRVWMTISESGITDLSINRFQSTLAEIPVAKRGYCTGAYFAAQDQIWMAVPTADSTNYASRILVLDEVSRTPGELTIFEPAHFFTRPTATINPAGNNNSIVFTANVSDATIEYVAGNVSVPSVAVTGNSVAVTLKAGVTTANQVIAAIAQSSAAKAILTAANAPANSGAGTIPGAVAQTAIGDLTVSAGVVAMKELSIPAAEPMMLVLCTDNKIYAYPNTDADVGQPFHSDYRCYLFSESDRAAHAVERIDFHNGGNVAGAVAAGIRHLTTSGADGAQNGQLLQKSNNLEPLGATFEAKPSRVAQLEFASDTTCTAQWAIRDLGLRTEEYR